MLGRQLGLFVSSLPHPVAGLFPGILGQINTIGVIKSVAEILHASFRLCTVNRRVKIDLEGRRKQILNFDSQ